MLPEILKSEKLQVLEQTLKEHNSVLIENLWNAPKALVAALAQKATGKHILILTGASLEEVRLFHDFSFFSEHPVVDFPAWETLPSENLAPSPDIVGERYKVLHEISVSKEPYIILSNLQACLQRIIPQKNFEKLYLKLSIGDEIAFEDLTKKLEAMGYKRNSVASDKGEFAVRGGIIDLFPVASPDPFRIEFWGNEIESIRIYDPVGQKSVKKADAVAITPAQEMELVSKSQQLSTIMDYLGPETIVIFDDLLALEDRYTTLLSISGVGTRSFCTIEQFLDQIEPLQKIMWSQNSIEELSEIRILGKASGGYYSETAAPLALAFQLFNREFIVKRWTHAFVPLIDYLLPEVEGEATGQEIINSLSKLAKTDCILHILCTTDLDETTFRQRLIDGKIALPKHTQFHLNYLSGGVVLADVKSIILPLTEINHRYKIRRQKQRSTYHTAPSEVYDLSPGEMVVHLNHGIGKFLGLEKRANHQGVVNEFMSIEYADSAKLYAPLNQAYLVSKYIGSSDENPTRHTLGGTRWAKTREKTEQAILGYASELLELYATREMHGGYGCAPDSSDMKAFEDDFPFTATEDQLSAIQAIKQDMISTKGMDRLVCGDVGYGKTEVAMRAAFKAVIDGQKQVAVLVPTTVLAMQHYESFVERMANFPVNIAVVSRFRTPKQIREALAGVANGSIDILIGTHRLISEDIKFKDLGLVIIDEEQRFGVKVKEHLKKIKAGVDYLTLSATPIPRTLYMSLVGVRDMSVISTPPQDRLPITTIISETQDQVLKSALLRELTRDGQAFVIHNRVDTIFDMAARIQKLLPQAKVVVGHGQMHADELDSVFHLFKSGQADILVATTIIENGIDIPNANTILIDRADRFGMADLYQMRGRVGRWNRRAYSYFLVPSLRVLPEISRKRLDALAKASGYGGGMKIAMSDLEIRGAGDMLGLEQSGHVSSIGFHLYCKLLKRMILTLQRKIPSALADVKMEFFMDARIPEEYVETPGLRMEVYHKLGEALSFEEVDDIMEELKDRFGKLPEPAMNLYHMTRLRVFGSKYGFGLIKIDKLTMTAERHKGKQVTARKLLLPKYKDAKDLEAKVVQLLVKEFQIL